MYNLLHVRQEDQHSDRMAPDWYSERPGKLNQNAIFFTADIALLYDIDLTFFEQFLVWLLHEHEIEVGPILTKRTRFGRYFLSNATYWSSMAYSFRQTIFKVFP